MVGPQQWAVDGVYCSDRILYFLQVQGKVHVLMYKMGWDVLPWVYPRTGLNEERGNAVCQYGLLNTDGVKHY